MHAWLAHYDSDVRPSLAPYPNATLLDYLSQLAREHGSKTALLFKGASVSYRRLEAESNAFAAALVAEGVKPGDRVALVLPNCPQFFVAEFGVWKAGAIVVPLNPTYSEREMLEALDAMRVEVVVTLTPELVLLTLVTLPDYPLAGRGPASCRPALVIISPAA